jgi:hypothetical protein
VILKVHYEVHCDWKEELTAMSEGVRAWLHFVGRKNGEDATVEKERVPNEEREIRVFSYPLVL